MRQITKKNSFDGEEKQLITKYAVQGVTKLGGNYDVHEYTTSQLMNIKETLGLLLPYK